MFLKEKEKRKGRPGRRWGVILGLLAAIVLGLGVYLWMIVRPAPPRPPAETFELVTFDVSESQDQIAISWRGRKTSLMATRQWSDVQRNAPSITNILSGMDDEYVELLAHQPNGSALASITFPNPGRLYLTTTHQLTFPYVDFMKYSPDGSWLLIGTPEKDIMLFQTTKPDQSYKLEEDDKTISTGQQYDWDMVMSADNTRLAVAGMLDDTIIIRVMQISDQKVIYETKLPYDNPQTVLAFHPNSMQLAVALDKTVHRIDLVNGEQTEMPVLWGEIQQIDYDSTGRWLAARSRYEVPANEAPKYGVVVYDLAAETRPIEPVLLRGDGHAVKFQFLKDRLVIGSALNQLTVWQWENGIWKNTGTVSVAWEN